MKHKVWKYVMNYEKEEKWLNEMAAKGMHFVDFSPGRYTFEEGKPGEYIYRIELLDQLPGNIESKAYIKWMEESGVECVASFFRWVYFRKRKIDGPFDLYSDFDSRIKHYKRVASLAGVIGGVNLISAINISRLAIVESESILLFFSLFNWVVAIAILKLFFTYRRKVRILKREKQLYE